MTPPNFDLPEGEYQIRVYRGPEYRAVRRTVRNPAGQDHRGDVGTWSAGSMPAAAGLVFGREPHPRQLRLRAMVQLAADDAAAVCGRGPARLQLHGGQLRRRRRLRPLSSSAAGPTRSRTARTILYWNEEFRSTIWGHMTLLNLRQLVEPIFTGFLDTTHP